MGALVLYQFPVSHYCEKTRWQLDAKGLTYRLVNLIPGLHRYRTRRLGQRSSTLPILMDDRRVIPDSTEIALHLEREYPGRPLLPPDDTGRRRALDLEDYFDDAFGIHCRRWMYYQVMASPLLAEVVFRGYGAPARIMGRLAAPMLRRGLRQLYKLTPENAAESRARLLAGIDRLERELSDDPTRYLVGGKLSLADVTAAALLAPLLSPVGSPWQTPAGAEVPPEIAALRAEVNQRSAGKWLHARYASDRKRLAA